MTRDPPQPRVQGRHFSETDAVRVLPPGLPTALPRGYISPMNSAGAAILGRMLKPERDDLPPEAARSLLKLEFAPEDLSRMHELALRAQAGSLTDTEENELESYRRIGRLLEVMRSKARRSLARAGLAA